MPTVDDLSTSKYLQKVDVDPPIAVTIAGYEQVNMAFQGEKPDLKWALNFKEDCKPLSLNVTNGERIKVITGSGDFDDWIGTKITLFNDKTVSFNGKFGGIRVFVKQQEVVVPEPEPISELGPTPFDAEEIENA